MQHARFVAVNVFIIAIIVLLWLKGFWQALPAFPPYELVMIAILGAYFSLGMALVVLDRNTAAHIANSLPILALGFTGLSLVIAVGNLHAVNPAALAVIFHELAYAIAPNIAGVLMMAWLREVMWFAYREGI